MLNRKAGMFEQKHLENGFSSKESKFGADHLKRVCQQADRQKNNNSAGLQEACHTDIDPEASTSRSQESDLSRKVQLEVQKDSSLYYQFSRDQTSGEELKQILKELVTNCCSFSRYGGISGYQKLGDQLTLNGKLGEGARAKIFSARDMILEEYIAIKVLKPDGVNQTEEDVRKFCREIEMMAPLNHKHVMSLRGFGCKDGVPFLVMELVDDGTLKGIRLFQREQVVKMMEQACSGVQYLHDQGIIHQDLKPANILRRRNGEVVITDFDVAIKAGAREAEWGWGTPRYEAPEQWEGKACLQSNVYPLGLIAFELLTGRNPIDCMMDDKECQKQLKDEKAAWKQRYQNRCNSNEDLERGWMDWGQYRCLHERASEWLETRGYKWLEKGARDAFLPAILRALKPNPQERTQSPNDLAEELRDGLRKSREREKEMSSTMRALRGIKIKLQECTWGNQMKD